MSRKGDEGYATPAAAVICFCIAMVVVAVSSRAMSEVRLAKTDFTRLRAQYALDGVHNAALLAVALTEASPPYRWSTTLAGETYEVVAEPEYSKLSLAAAAALDDEAFAGLGVTEASSLRRRLTDAAGAHAVVWVADQSDAKLWRACAASVASSFGRAATLAPITYGAPVPAGRPPLWRAGEVWRFRVMDTAGWRDERLVRMTGDSLNPAAVIERRVTHGSKAQQTCDEMLGGLAVN